MIEINESPVLNAVLVSVQTPKISDAEMKASLQELGRLVTTLGYRIIGQMSQRRGSQRSAAVLGEGKLQELASWTGGTGQVAPMVVKKKSKAAMKFASNKEDDEDDLPEEEDEVFIEDATEDFQAAEEAPREKAQVIIFDCDLSPSQLRNVESATGVPVLDRTGVIIEIFSRHARTRAARLQVEIARLTYLAPRIRETSAASERIGGKGSGETGVELDRRRIRDRIKELKQEFSSIDQEHLTRRSRRSQEFTVALVGYTNAGKSSLMRALTGSEVLVADKLFATLDTTVRALQPETVPRILVSDTVGFIKKLPHDLVASFRSTLDEALNASLLLYVVDASDPTFRSQMEVTRQVLGEVGAGEVPSLLLLNKRDRLSTEEIEALRGEFPEAIFLSAKDPQDIAEMHTRLVKASENTMIEKDILIPYDVQGAIGEIRAQMRVLSEDYNERGAVLRVRTSEDALKRLRSKFGI